MANFEQLYRDISQQYPLEVLEQRGLYFNDLLNIINDEYASTRIEMVKTGRGQPFLVTEDVYAVIPDISYPEFYYAELQEPLLSAVPVQQAVYSSLVWYVSDQIQNSLQSFTKGDKKSYNGGVYVAVNNVSAVNTFGLTFYGKKVRNYKAGNSLSYQIDDILYDTETRQYWKVTEAFTSTSADDLSTKATRVYWKYLFGNYDTANHYDFFELTRNRMYVAIDGEHAFAIQDNKLYTPKQNKRFTISYVPEWDNVTDLATEVVMPSSMLYTIRRNIMMNLAKKVELQNVAGR